MSMLSKIFVHRLLFNKFAIPLAHDKMPYHQALHSSQLVQLIRLTVRILHLSQLVQPIRPQDPLVRFQSWDSSSPCPASTMGPYLVNTMGKASHLKIKALCRGINKFPQLFYDSVLLYIIFSTLCMSVRQYNISNIAFCVPLVIVQLQRTLHKRADQRSLQSYNSPLVTLLA